MEIPPISGAKEPPHNSREQIIKDAKNQIYAYLPDGKDFKDFDESKKKISEIVNEAVKLLGPQTSAAKNLQELESEADVILDQEKKVAEADKKMEEAEKAAREEIIVPCK